MGTAIRRWKIWTLRLLPLAMLLQSCGTSTLFLKKNQYLFQNARVKGAKHVDAEALIALQQQKPNRQILGSAPYLYFYQIGERFYDKGKEQAQLAAMQARYAKRNTEFGDSTTRKAVRLRNRQNSRIERQKTVIEEGNWMMRTVGEPPSIFDSSAVYRSARDMQNYMFNKGFFDSEVKAEVDTVGKRIKVVYRVTEGPDQRIRNVRYKAFNPIIQRITDSVTTKGQRLVASGDRYDQDKITQERERLDKAIRNSGFFTFSREFIFVDADTGSVDSALGSRIIDLLFEITETRGQSMQRFKIQEAVFRINPASTFEKNDTILRPYNGIDYYTPYRRLSYRTLDSKVLVRPGEYYNLNKLTNTQAQLQAIDIFRFVNLSYDTLPGQPHQFRLNVQATRLPKYQISNEVGLLISQGAPGPFINEGFKVRNALNSFDIFELSARYSQEGQVSFFSQQGVFRARELGLTGTITFPAIVFPNFTTYLFNDKNPKTRLTLGYTDVKRPDYSQNIIKLALGYSINLNPQALVGINPIDASIVRTSRVSAGYAEYLEQQDLLGNPLIRTFNSNQIVTSLSGFYVYNSAGTMGKQRGRYFRIFGEVGGFVPNLLAKSYTENPLDTDARGRDGRYIVNDRTNIDLRVFRFTKLQVDYRYYYPTSKYTVWVARVNTGIAVPLGDSKLLPYVKYFFTGGSNSIRAWAPRRLGPGSFDGGMAGEFQAEQPGEVLFEANLEVRRKLIGFFEGALFADVGNIFTLKPDEARPGGEFKLGTVLETLAVGVGPGLRMDFSFLVVRLDAGIKAYDPSAPKGDKWVIRNALKKSTDGYQRVVLNIGIGYPF